ncbi:unnamed protein product [Phaedon cochleariae]|uniref:Mutator-like transposase domain-containing protein n=1 Tax=Phaedon cochleariae TaxID=80249 RepID=A0A9N9WZW0_PHACE|nr:unnamed protein product [Phaedon cochleariae]
MPRIFVKNSRRGLHLKREHKNTEDEQVQKKISCAARLAANISSQVHSKDENLTSSDNNVAENCTPLRRSWSFDSESSESLPELEIEVVRLPGQFDPKIRNISGRRIIDISHFITEVRRLENHVCNVKPTGYLSFDREQKIGLHSKLFFKCAACGHSTSITTNKPDKSEPNANFLASWGALASGKGHFFLEEYLSLLDIPPLTKPTFLKYQQELGDSWNECLIDSIQAAGAEEYKFAVESNNMAERNIGQCTVVVDGGWSHRSYGHRYTSKSGVACIIGKHTKQLLFIGVRNKYCSVCAISERKGEEVRRHKCFKNWSGSSPAMEADIIVEGFIHSQSMHNLQYTAFIADGDSSVHSKILEHVPYSRKIKKIECANHLTKNVTKHLHELAKESSANRKMLSSNRINYIGKSCRKLISIHARKSTPCVANLKHDLQNVVSHVFGNHRNCRAKNCLKVGQCNENDFQEASTETQLRIMRIVGNLTSKADSLITDSTSNSAEQFMRQVAKFNSAKQTFYGRRNSFNIRCHGAGLAYQFGPRWMIEAFKHKFKKSPSNILKRLVRERTNNNFLGRSRRKRLFNVEAKISDKNCDYGASCNKPDLPDEEIQNLIKEQIKILNITCEEQMEIEKSTRGQSDNPKWFEARKSRLTASKFREICKRRINHGKLVESMLYKTLPRMKQIEYGKMNESVAIEAYSSKVGKYVSPCGLFVCTDQGYGFLGASPDGLIV